MEKEQSVENSVLMSYDWDLQLLGDFRLLDICDTSDEEKAILAQANKYATKCNICGKNIVIDYTLPKPEDKLVFIAKGIMQYVISKLIQTIKVDAKDSDGNIAFTLVGMLDNQEPEWNICFGDKNVPLTIQVSYKTTIIKIV